MAWMTSCPLLIVEDKPCLNGLHDEKENQRSTMYFIKVCMEPFISVKSMPAFIHIWKPEKRQTTVREASDARFPRSIFKILAR